MKNPPEKAARVTIHEVAALAGVSIKTVSRVLRKEALVSDSTRAAVERVVRELSYLPDLSARGLKSNLPNTIGLVRGLFSEDSGDFRAGHEYMMCMQVGAMRATNELDFGLLMIPVLRHTDEALREIRTRFKRRQVAGYLIPAPVSDLPGLLDGLTASGIPYAAISPNRLDLDGSWVAVDERAGAEALVSYLIAQGHRRIAFIRSDPHLRATIQREAGWRDALFAAGITPDESWIEYAEDLIFNAGRRCGHRLFSRPNRVTAVFAFNDNIAAGVINAAHERGLKLPEDMSIVGYDDLELARKIWPNLTTVRQPIEKMGEISARQLVARLQPLRQMAQRPESQVMLSSDLVIRSSATRPRSI